MGICVTQAFQVVYADVMYFHISEIALIYMRKKLHNRYFLLSRYQVCDSVPNPLHVLTSLIPKQH